MITEYQNQQDLQNLEGFTGFSPFMLLSGKQPAGTADPPSRILRETRDHKSECYTAHTRTEENTNHFQSFHWKKTPTVSSSTQSNSLIRLPCY